MNANVNWVNDAALAGRAPKGGCIGVDGKFRKGGEFEAFYVPRPVMPQIDPDKLTSLIEFCSERGIAVIEVTHDPADLHFHQRVNMARVESMPDDAYNSRILISSDGYVIDGNHRATAHKLRNEPAPCLQIEADFEVAMTLIFEFPDTYDGDAA